MQSTHPASSTMHAHSDPSSTTHHSSTSPAWRFFKLLQPERHDILLLLTFSLFAGILYLAAPLTVDAVVSNLSFGSQSKPYLQTLIILALALAGALTLQAVISGFQYYVSDVIQRRIFVRTAASLAHQLPRVKTSALDDIHAPELINYFLEVVTVQKNTSLLLLDGINLLLGCFIGMILLALYHPTLLLFVLILLILTPILTLLLGRGAVQSSIAESKMKYDLVHWFEEIATFPNLFKGPSGYQLATNRANQIACLYLQRRSEHFSILMRQIGTLLTLSVIASASLLVLGCWLVISQQITLGQLVAAELIMTSIVAAMAKVGKKLEAWYDALAAMDKLGHLFDLDCENPNGKHVANSHSGIEISATQLSFAYPDIPPIFKNLNFSIPASSHTAIVAPHGAGSSTLLDLIYGLRQPHHGYLTLNQIDLRNWYLPSLRSQTMLIRRGEIIEGTILDNLKLGFEPPDESILTQALDRVGLLHSILLHPDGFNRSLKISGAPLNNNQRTRLLIARALVHQPNLLLIDEIFDGLDQDSFTTLTQAVLDPSLPWTVVITTRKQELIDRCDHSIQLPTSQSLAAPLP